MRIVAGLLFLLLLISWRIEHEVIIVMDDQRVGGAFTIRLAYSYMVFFMRHAKQLFRE